MNVQRDSAPSFESGGPYTSRAQVCLVSHSNGLLLMLENE